MSKSNSASDVTIRDIIKKEYAKCAADPAYFMKKYCFIQHPQKGKILFELYPFQEDTLHQFRDNVFNIVLKCRQMGISTLVAGYSLWMMLFKPDSNILVIATTQETAKNLVTKVREMKDKLPSWLRGVCKEDNRLSLRFSNGSQIKAESSSASAARSQALSLLVIDEAAFIDGVDEIWTSAAPTLSTGGRAIVLSTPNGVGNFFHSKWIEAESGVKDAAGKGFNPIKLHWSLHPLYTQAWRDAQDKISGERNASQECDCNFLTSGNTVIPADILLYYQGLISDPVDKMGQERTYFKWGYPKAGGSYIVAADVARGDGSDYNAFQVLDVESMEQMAEYKGRLDTTSYGEFLVAVSKEWNNALLVIENATYGWAVIQAVINMNYDNLFYTSEDLAVVDVHRSINNNLNRADKHMVPGFTNSSKTRPLIINKLDLYMRDKEVILHSKRLNDELFTFIWDGNKAKAMRGYNDDMTLALAIGLWVRDTALRLRTEGIEATKAAINSIKRDATDAPVFYTPKSNLVKDPWKFQVGKDQENLTWLL